MSDKKASTHAGNGLGLGTVTFLIFMTLKLTDNIDWSWWWVTAPLWGPIAAVALVILLATFGAACGWAIDKVLK